MPGYRAYHTPLPATPGTLVELSRAETHHLRKVLRARSGDNVTAFDGSGRYATGILRENGNIHIETLGTQPPPPYTLELAAALLKNKNHDALLRASVECGITCLQLLETEHSEVHLSPRDFPAKTTRWHDLLVEAAKQSANLRLPELPAPLPLSTALENTSQQDALQLVASLKPGTPPLLSVLKDHKNHLSRHPHLRLFIGPEGDFSSAEYAQLHNAGALPVGLGPHVLRAPTAAIYALGTIAQFLSTLDD